MSKSDGSTADYYELPAGCTELQDLISHRDLNAQLGEIFRACYRYGHASHSDKMRDAKKIRFYADAEVKRLEKLEQQKAGWTDETIKAASFAHGGPISPGAVYRAGEQSLPCNSPVRGIYVDPYDEPAASIDDDSARMQAIGQNGEMAAEIYSALDGWIKWRGGDQPVRDKVTVDVMFPDGSTDTDRAGAFGWDHSGHNYSIIAYRQTKEAI